MKKYIAEFIGTFALTLIVIISTKSTLPFATPLLAALTLGLFVYSIGRISGTHINPAVSIGAFSIKKISLEDLNYYIISQFLGSGAALLILKLFSITVPATASALTFTVFFAELIGTFFFTFGIASVVYNKTPDNLSGIVVGGSLFLGIMFASLLGSLGGLNPAVLFGLGAFNLAYLLGPIAGAILGMNTYKYLVRE